MQNTRESAYALPLGTQPSATTDTDCALGFNLARNLDFNLGLSHTDAPPF